MAGARLVVVVTMVGSVLGALGCDDVAFVSQGSPLVHRRLLDLPLVDADGLGALVPTVVFACT